MRQAGQRRRRFQIGAVVVELTAKLLMRTLIATLTALMLFAATPVVAGEGKRKPLKFDPASRLHNH